MSREGRLAIYMLTLLVAVAASLISDNPDIERISSIWIFANLIVSFRAWVDAK